MRFAIIVKSSHSCAAGTQPDEQFMAEMGRFNDDLAKAGVLVALERLKPGSEGAQVRISGNGRTAIDGPFAETKEVIGGFWIWNCKSQEEAIAWVKRCPTFPGGTADIEIREILEPADINDPFAVASSQKPARPLSEAIA